MSDFQIRNEELVGSLVEAAGALPQCQVLETHRQQLSEHHPVDAVIDLEIAGKSVQLLVETRREAFPRDVRELLWQLRNHLPPTKGKGKEIVPLLAARTISSGARDLLREEGVGFFDLSGSLFIPSDVLYVLIDRPSLKRSRRVLSLLEGQKARTIMTLFEHRDEWIGVKQLAELAEVSPATASATLREMERREWVEVAGTGPAKVRRLGNPTPLVEEWSRHASEQKAPRIARYFMPSRNIDAICASLDQSCRDNGMIYAVTGEAAVQHYAPFLSAISQVRCRMLPGRLQERVLNELGAQQVSEGWNLGIVQTRSPNDVIVGDERAGIALAPALQVYLDLLQESGRSRELAGHLRTETLRA